MVKSQVVVDTVPLPPKVMVEAVVDKGTVTAISMCCTPTAEVVYA